MISKQIGVVAAILIGIARFSPRDDDLTIHLPPGKANTAAPRKSIGRTVKRSGRSSRRGGRPAEKVVGRLAVISSDTSAYREATRDSEALAELKTGTYVAVIDAGQSFFVVLMSDRSRGYVPKGDLDILNYEVVDKNKPPLSPTEQAIRAHQIFIGMDADDVRRSIGRPRSVHSVESRFGKAETWSYARRKLTFVNGDLELIETSR